MLKNHLIGPLEGFSDEESERLGSLYDVQSYQGICTLGKDLQITDPFFVASKNQGSYVIGLTKHLGFDLAVPPLCNLSFNEFSDQLENARRKGILRFVDEYVEGLYSHSRERGLYFPSEEVVRIVLKTKNS